MTGPFTQGRPSNPEREEREQGQAWGEVKGEQELQPATDPRRGGWEVLCSNPNTGRRLALGPTSATDTSARPTKERAPALPLTGHAPWPGAAPVSLCFLTYEMGIAKPASQDSHEAEMQRVEGLAPE